MDLIFAWLAGLLTLINPCVLPVLPIVLATSLRNDPRAPLALAGGMSLSFVVLGTGVAAFGPAIGLYPEDILPVAALGMVLFGTVMVVPALGRRFATATAGVSAVADTRMGAADRGLSGRGLAREALGGALLGAVWSPCIGPTLGAAIALASTGEGLGRAAAIMVAFSLGVSTLILLAAYALQGWMRRNAARLTSLATAARPAMGGAFIAVGLALFFGLNHVAEAAILRVLPPWLIDFSVRF